MLTLFTHIVYHLCMTKNSILNNSINYVLMALAFLMPVFFLPVTSEYFEFNKLVLLSLATCLIFILWGVKLLIVKKVQMLKSPLVLPLVILGIVLLLSTVFSLSPYVSIFGKYGRWFPSLFGYIVLFVFYFATSINTSNAKAATRVLSALAASTTISSVVGLLSYFGLYLGSAGFMKNPSFTFTGSTTTAAILASFTVVIALNRILYSNKMPFKILWIQVAIVNALLPMLYTNIPGIVVIILGLVATLLMNKPQLVKQNSVFVMALAGIIASMLIFTQLPQTKRVLQNEEFAREVNLTFGESWVISSATLTDFPLLGSGPSTFNLNFTRYRPVKLNASNLWNVRFDKPTNEVFNLMGTVGIIGLIAVVYFSSKVLKLVAKSYRYEDEDGATPTLGILVLLSMLTMFFTYATVLNAFIFFLLLGLLTAVVATSKKLNSQAELIQLSLTSLSSITMIGGIAEGLETKKKGETLQYFAIVPIILFVVGVSYYTYRQYMAEYYMKKSIDAATANDGTGTYQNQRKAINLNPQRAEYRNTYARTNLLLASNLSKSENLTDEDKKTIQTLIAQSIREARLSTEVISPLSAGSWEIRANVYKSLIGVADNAEQWTLGSYNTAIQLDPTNPRLRLEAGSIYYLTEDYLSAANFFRQATNLKPDYANAHYNLAQALKQLQNYTLAQRELELVLQIIPQDSPDRQRVQTEIDELKKLTAEQAQNNPTVESLDQQAQIEEQGQITEQEPLTQPGQVETIGTNEQEQIDLNQQGQVQQPNN